MNMWIFFIFVVLFHIACYTDLFEVNNITLLIPALEFSNKGAMYGLRSLYLLIFFLEYVIALPIVEQRFYFIFMSNMIGEQNIFKLGGTFVADLYSRNGLLNQFFIYGYHFCTYLPVLYLNFGEDSVQMTAVFILIAMNLVVVHSMRASYGVISSICVHMIFNFSVWYLLCIIYYSDHLHKGFIAEKHTTLRKNSIDFIFGQNEDYAANI